MKFKTHYETVIKKMKKGIAALYLEKNCQSCEATIPSWRLHPLDEEKYLLLIYKLLMLVRVHNPQNK